MDVMADNIKAIPFNTNDEGVDYPTLAKNFLWTEINQIDPIVKFDDIYIVMFSYILGGWKALLSTSRPDGKYYEVTHNPSKKETYVDTYVKVANTKYTLEGETE